MHVNWNALASRALNNSTLTTNGITRGPISCTGSGTKPTTATVAGVYIGLDNAAAGGMEICSSASQYIDFASTNIDYKGRMLYNSDTVSCCVGRSAAARLTLSGTAIIRD